MKPSRTPHRGVPTKTVGKFPAVFDFQKFSGVLFDIRNSPFQIAPKSDKRIKKEKFVNDGAGRTVEGG